MRQILAIELATGSKMMLMAIRVNPSVSHLAKEGSSLLLSVGSHDQGTCPRTGVTQFRRALPPLPGKGTRACCREKSSRRFPGVPKVSCFLKESFLVWLDKKKNNEGQSLQFEAKPESCKNIQASFCFHACQGK